MGASHSVSERCVKASATGNSKDLQVRACDRRVRSAHAYKWRMMPLPRSFMLARVQMALYPQALINEAGGYDNESLRRLVNCTDKVGALIGR